MPIYHAIAAAAENLVIGDKGKLPWHLPDEYRWFKSKTMGGTMIMGRKTFESIGRPLPGRKTVVVSRSLSAPGIDTYTDLAHLDEKLAPFPQPVWVCGGVEIYRQLLDRCGLLYLTRIKRSVSGDAVFPAFENHFRLDQIIHDETQFRVERWINTGPAFPQEYPRETWPFTK